MLTITLWRILDSESVKVVIKHVGAHKMVLYVCLVCLTSGWKLCYSGLHATNPTRVFGVVEIANDHSMEAA